jgi:hypothetical protein
MAVTPNNAAAVEFLKLVYPDGPWVLTAIRTDRKAIDTRTFRPANQEALDAWLKLYNGDRNIYWSVNPPIKDLTKKAEREDIKEVAYLHVDIDPRAGEDLGAERERCAALFASKLPSGIPAPTAVIFSGGGYQGFWKLESAIPIGGDLSLAEDAKRYNQQLELLFEGDNCHNIDRIMRLPGTINVPDERKKKKGRLPELAVLVSWTGEEFPLERFTASPVVQIKDMGGFAKPAGERVVISGNIERLTDINELDVYGVPDRVKVVCVQGKDPDNPKTPDNSRSMWVFDCVCQLLRSKVPAEVVFSILTDPEFGISESILEKGSGAERYALRQIERAQEEIVDPWLRLLNERYAVILNIGGKCRIVEEVMDAALNRSRLTRLSFEDFANGWRNKQVKIGEDAATGAPKFMKVGKWWPDHAQRREYNSIVFAPNKDVPNVYNLWKGYAVDAKPGDCGLFLKHVLDNVCQGDEVLYNYTIGWMARAVQRPGEPGQVAIVLRGGKGVGKSLFAKVFGSLWGRHFLQVSNPSHLVGNFNSHLRDTVVLFADEAFYAGDKKHESILKTLITEDTIQIEAKGVDVETCPNYVHLIMASNYDHVVPASGDERRFFVLDVGAAKQQDRSYFKAILKQLDDGGREALLHMLLTLDLSDYEVRNVPATAALTEQKELSLTPEEDWWFNKLKNGAVFGDETSWSAKARKTALVDDYIEHTKRWNVHRRGTETALGKFLHKHAPGLESVQQMATYTEVDGNGFGHEVRKQANFWVLPGLQQCRDVWEEIHGKHQWKTVRQIELAIDKPPF